MKVEVKVPGVGESITEGLLASWATGDGSTVIEGRALFELETDKTTIDVTAPATGRLTIAVPEGSDVAIDQVVGVIDTAPPTAEEESGPYEKAAGEKADRVTPAARAAGAREGMAIAGLDGGGREGTLTKADVLAAAGASDSTGGDARAPQVGPGSPPTEATAAEPGPWGPLPPSRTRELRKPLSRIRKAIAANLTRTRNELVLLTTFNEADMSAVKRLRSRHGEAFRERHEVKLGFMSFFLKASAAALTRFPEVNAYIDGTGGEVVYRDGIHISVAVSTAKGLVTPVVRNVDSKSFAAVEKEILSFGQKAVEKTLMPDDLIGGTFTVTNGGIFGSMMSTPLPATNQSAILGMHAIQQRPVARDGEVVIRPMMYLALSYDHRLIDGREAVGCLKMIKEAVEDPERLLLGV